MDFYTLLETNLGKSAKNIILMLYFVTFMIKGITPILEQRSFVERTLYESTHNFFMFLPFFAVCFFLCLKNLRVIGRVSDLLFVPTILGIVLIYSLSISNADFTAILPVGASGLPSILRGSYLSFNWFGDAVYLMFFIGQFKYKKNDFWKIFVCHLLPSIAVVFFMVMFYGIFTSIAHRQYFALTEISKYSLIINNVGRFDYLAILFLLLSNFFALSLPLFFASHILTKVFNFKKHYISVSIVIGLYLVLLLFLERFTYSITSVITNYFNLLFFITCNILPILLLFLRKDKKNENNVV